MNKSFGLIGSIGLASLLATGSIVSHAAYVRDGLADDFPRFMLVAIGIAVVVQALTTVALVLTKSLRAWIAFLIVACGIGFAELMAYSGVFFVRDFMSSAAGLVALVGVYFSWMESREDREIG